MVFGQIVLYNHFDIFLIVSFCIKLYNGADQIKEQKAKQLWEQHIILVCIIILQLPPHTYVHVAYPFIQHSEMIDLEQSDLAEFHKGLTCMRQLKVPEDLAFTPTHVTNFLLRGPVRPFLNLR